MVYDYRPCLFCLRGFPSSQRNQTDEDRAKSKICHVDPCQASEASEAELNQKCSSNLGLPSVPCWSSKGCAHQALHPQCV